MSQFRYFPTFPEHADLRDRPCVYCGRAPSIPGVRLNSGPESSQPACADCLAIGKAAVKIPKWVITDLERAVSTTHPDWSVDRQATYVAERIDELAHTPPIPWLQNNEWPVCGDDFAVYEGELTRENLEQRTGDLERAKDTLHSILSQTVPNWEQDAQALEGEWSELGNYLAIFAFQCSDSGEARYVVQTA